MATAFQILKQLADGQFHSGQALGEQFGVSRAAISKALKHCAEMGVDVHAVSGKGYRLAHKLDLLDESVIRNQLNEKTLSHIQSLRLWQTLASTSQQLLDTPLGDLDKADVCIAEHQSVGRGRRGRLWVSPYGVNLYFSIRWRYSTGPAGLSGLSIAIGVALARALGSLGIQDLQLKWPNDVLLAGKKVAGILIDVAGEANGPCTMIAGIGINLAMSDDAGSEISQPWANLSECGVSRNQIMVSVLGAIIECLATFAETGLKPYLSDWQHYDAFHDEKIKLIMPNKTIHGHNSGLDSDGSLLLRIDGQLQRFAMGEISLRANDKE